MPWHTPDRAPATPSTLATLPVFLLHRLLLEDAEASCRLHGIAHRPVRRRRRTSTPIRQSSVVPPCAVRGVPRTPPPIYDDRSFRPASPQSPRCRSNQQGDPPPLKPHRQSRTCMGRAVGWVAKATGGAAIGNGPVTIVTDQLTIVKGRATIVTAKQPRIRQYRAENPSLSTPHPSVSSTNHRRRVA